MMPASIFPLSYSEIAFEHRSRLFFGALDLFVLVFFREGGKRLPTTRLRFGNAEIGECGELSSSQRPNSWTMTTGIALPVILHFGQQLAGPDLGAHTDFGSVVDQFALFRLLGIDLHRNGLVANVFDLVDAPSLGQRAPS